MQSFNRNSIIINDTNQRPFIPILFSPNNNNVSAQIKKEDNKEHQNSNVPEKNFNKEEENKDLIDIQQINPQENSGDSLFGNLEFSAIPKKEDSLFLDWDEMPEFQNKNKKRKKAGGNLLRSTTFLVKSNGFDSYLSIINYFFQDKSKKYNYYFCYDDRKENYYFQIQYLQPKDVTLSEIEKYKKTEKKIQYQFIPPISDYGYFQKLLEDTLIFHININKNLKFITLQKGPKGTDFWKTNAKMLYYAMENNMDLYS